MARIFITGSADGLGRMAAELLVEQGHRVVLHARSQARADETKRNVPEAEAVVIGDLGTIAQTRKVAEQVNALGALDAVIHNAAVGYKEPKRIETEDGLSHVFAVNTIAPYILTALIAKPKRLVYLSSMLHQNGDSRRSCSHRCDRSSSWPLRSPAASADAPPSRLQHEAEDGHRSIR